MNAAVDKYSRNTGRFPLNPGIELAAGTELPDGAYGTHVRFFPTAAAKLEFVNQPGMSVPLAANIPEYFYVPPKEVEGAVKVLEGTVNIMW